MKAPEMQEAFAREGAAPVAMTSAQFADFIKVEIDKWGRVVKEGGIAQQ
jgi:tripartite-type tricarboxylate transporter receptor subunit TctC